MVKILMMYACLGVTWHLNFLAEWLGSFTCHCSNKGWNGHQIRVSTESQLWRRKSSRHSCWDSNSQPFNQEYGGLPTRYLASCFTWKWLKKRTEWLTCCGCVVSLINKPDPYLCYGRPDGWVTYLLWMDSLSNQQTWPLPVMGGLMAEWLTCCGWTVSLINKPDPYLCYGRPDGWVTYLLWMDNLSNQQTWPLPVLWEA